MGLKNTTIAFILFVIIFFDTHICFSQWAPTNGPKGGPIYNMAVYGSNIYATTELGASSVWFSANYGKDWELLPMTANSIFAYGSTVYAIGLPSKIYKSVNFGKTWYLTHNSNFNGQVGSCIWGRAGTDTLVMVGSYSGLFKTTNSGINWITVDNGPHISQIINQNNWVFDDHFYFSSCSNNFQFPIFYGNYHMTELSSGNIFALLTGTSKPLNRIICNGYTPVGDIPFPSGSSQLYNKNQSKLFLTGSGGVAVSSNSGVNWTVINSGLEDINVRSFGTDGNQIFAGTVNDGIYMSTNDGQNWSLQDNNGLINSTVTALYSDNQTIYAGKYGISVSTNNGINWSQFRRNGLPSTIKVRAITINSNVIFLGSEMNGIYTSTNEGLNWVEANSGLTYFNISSLLNKDGIIFAGSSINGMYKSTDSGANWSFINPGTNNPVNSLFRKDNFILAGSSGGGIFKSTDDGFNWVQKNSGLISLNINSINSVGSVLLAGTYQEGIFKSTNNGDNWIQINNNLQSPLNVNSIAVKGSDIYISCKINGSSTSIIYKSSDIGNNWTDTGLDSCDILTANDSYVFGAVQGRGVWKYPYETFDITSTDPGYNSINKNNNVNFSIAFSSDANQSSVSSNNIKLYGDYSGLINANVNYYSSTKTAVIDPVNPFKFGEKITVLTGGVLQNTYGTVLTKPKSFSFTVNTITDASDISYKRNAATGTNPEGLITADFDDDGDMDIAVANKGSNNISIMANDGAGYFAASSSISVTSPAVITNGDFDNDGDVDIATASNVTFIVTIFKNNGSGIFTQFSTLDLYGNSPRCFTVNDFDCDLDLDLIIGGLAAEDSVFVLMNDGTGNFTKKSTLKTAPSSEGIESADFDNDGDFDLVIADPNNNTVDVIRNNGKGDFSHIHDIKIFFNNIPSNPFYPASFTCADFNNDSLIDIAVFGFNNSGQVQFFKNNGNAAYSYSGYFTLAGYSYSVYNMTNGDIDGDGDIDIGVLNNNGTTLTVLKNNGSGIFTAYTTSAGTTSYGVLFTDVNKNGTLDAVTTNRNANTISELTHSDVVSGPMSGNYLVGLNSFNKASGRNLSERKFSRTVIHKIQRKTDAAEINSTRHTENNNISDGLKKSSDELNDVRNKHSNDNQGPYSKKNSGNQETIEVIEEYSVLYDGDKPYTGELVISDFLGNETFATLTAALSNLKNRGISGAVTFLLADISYSSETFPLDFTGISGMSSTNTITLKPYTGNTATISGASADYLFKITDLNYITIDGSSNGGNDRSLTINNTSTGGTFKLTGSSCYNTVKNCILKSGEGSNVLSINPETGTGTTNNIIDNCEITKSETGRPSCGVYLQSENYPVNNNTIKNCDIHDFGSNSETFAKGILIGSNSDNNIIQANRIYNSSVINCSPQYISGIELKQNANNIIERNKIYNLATLYSSGAQISGIFNQFIEPFSSVENTFRNNIIELGSAMLTGTNINLYGFYLQFNSGTHNLYNNSVYLAGDLQGGASACIYKEKSVLNMKNNISFNNASNGINNAISIKNLDALNSDYNNYYVTGSNVLFRDISLTYNTLPEWQTASGKDFHSISGNPCFVSISAPVDLHIDPTKLVVNGRGTYIPGVTNDFDGDARPNAQSETLSPVDIGADQYSPSGYSGNSTTQTGQTYYDNYYKIFEVTSGTFTGTIMSYPGLKAPNIITGKAIWHYWLLNGSITQPGDLNSIVRYYYNEEELGTIPEASLKLFAYEGGQWILKPTTVNPSENYIEITMSPGNISNTVYAIGDENNPLPITLSSMAAAIYENRNVKLNWKTTFEINNEGFQVERNENGKSMWNILGYVKGAGNSNYEKEYKFEDKKLQAGKFKYRLKQIDVNGNFIYYDFSESIDISVPVKFYLSQNYPNPFNPVTKIDYDLPVDGYVSVIVYDITGREIKTLVNENKKAGYYTVEFSAANLSSGVYFYRIIAKDFTSVKKMVILK